MAGKHRKTSRPAAVVAMVVAPAGLVAGAMAVGTIPSAVPTDTTVEAKSPSAVDLLALVTPANSTSQIFAGTTYYGTNYANTPYAPQQVVPFFLGPQGIANAIRDADDGTVVLASGWGAGQTGTALGTMSNDDLDNVDLVILDNNTNRAGGGFWTTYAPFAPLLLTSADPTPTDLPAGVTVLDVAYEYNINGNAPVDPLNPFTLGNSLMAYAYGYGQESTALNITQEGDVVVLHDVAPGNTDLDYIDADGDGEENDVVLEKGKHYVVKDGNVDVDDAGTQDSTIYVTVDSGDLPLTRPLRLFPGGDILADALDPTLTALVDAGYADDKGTEDDPAIPEDPTITRPMQPGSSLFALGGVSGTVDDGVDAGIDTAREGIEDPVNFVTKPIDEFKKLPLINTVVGSTQSANNNATTEKKVGTPDRPRPLKKIAENVRNGLKELSGADKPAGDAD